MTLLEVILAIAILGGSLAVLGELVRVGARAAQTAQTLSTAQLLAESLVAEISAGVSAPQPAQGVIDDYGGSRWAYIVQIEQVDQQGLLAVAVLVYEDVDPQQRPVTYSLVRWMIDPQTEWDLELEAAEVAAAGGTTGSSSASSSSSGSGVGGASAGTTTPAGGGR
jgi:general secretion pathway protein I